MSIYPPNNTTPKSPSGNYLWNWLGSPLKKFAAALSPYMGGGDAGVKKYVAQLGQTGTNAPVPIVLEDTTGLSMTWERQYLGVYFLRFNADVPLDKIFIPGTSSWTNAAPNVVVIPLTDQNSSGNFITGYLNVYLQQSFNPATASGIYMNTLDANGINLVEWNTLFGDSKFYFEFRIYP